MQVKKIRIQDIELAYAEKNASQKQTIFFISSNSSCRLWRKQFESNILNQYRLIAIELPGHGQSDRSINTDYDFSIQGAASILSEAVSLLAFDCSYFLVGFSYGTNLVAEMLQYGVTPSGIVLISSSITGKNFGIEKIIKAGVPNIYLQEENAVAAVMEFYNTHLLNSTQQDKEIYVEDFMAVQPMFRTTVLQHVAAGKYADEIELLNTFAVPLLIVWGDKDGLINPDYLYGAPLNLWNNQSYTLNDSGHFVITDQPDMFNTLLSQYISDRVLYESEMS